VTANASSKIQSSPRFRHPSGTDAALRRLAETVRVDLWDDDAPPPHDELVTHLRECDAVLSMVSDRFDAATIAAARRLVA